MSAPVRFRREVGGEIPTRLLAYVRRVLGPGAVGEVVAAAGEVRPLDELTDPRTWHSFEQVDALVRAAVTKTGDSDIGRRVGKEMFRAGQAAGLADFLVATGSVDAALELAANAGTKLSQGRTIRVTRSGPGYSVIEGTYRDLRRASPFFCGISTGYYAEIPTLFGGSAAGTETTCQFRGDDVCTFRIAWTEPAAREGIRGIVAGSRERSAETVRRLEQLHRMGSDLALADDVDSLLATIVDGAGTALRAPRYLLAVRVGDPPELRIHQRGFSAGAAEALAAEMMAGHDEPDADTVSTVVVDVASPRRSYGKLAALFPPEAQVTDTDRRLLSAYASHAVAALERIESLEVARRDRDTARALLDLATALAVVGATDEVAERLGRTVPRVTGCDEASVWLWDGAEEALELAAWVDGRGAPVGRGPGTLRMASLAGLRELVASPQPFVLDSATADPVLAASMAQAGLTHAVVVPISARGDFLGIVSAGFRVEPDAADRQRLFQVLSGIADHGATALDNARLLERIRHQALHDALTGLPNRPLIEDRAETALRRAQRDGSVTALLFIDLDRFKNVNDTLGHAAGDDVIRQASARLAGCIRAGDTLGRLGGDEFVILMPGLPTPDRATELAERIIGCMEAPFSIAGQEIFISCSIGVAAAPLDGTAYGELLQHADAAMYEAKGLGRSTYFVAGSVDTKPKRSMLELESALHRAVEHDQLRVLYQPQVDLTTMQLIGVEALVRWEHPALGLVTPDVFIPLAEESGLIVPIDRWVREQAFAQARRWRDEGLDLRMSVNLSTREVRNPRLPDEVAAQIARHGLDPRSVELEITDRVVMSEDDLPTLLHALEAIGVRLAVDDFGTGSSVLARLQSCPVDTLKIDKSFVWELRGREESPVVAALVAMAHRLDLEIVAEGVETAEQGAALRLLGCHMAQGYYFSRPVPADDVVRLARRRG